MMLLHPNSRQITAYALGYGEARLAPHFAQCPACRTRLAELADTLDRLDADSVPEPGADFGVAVWRRLAPALSEPAAAPAGRAFRSRWVWLPVALALAAVLAATIYLRRPAPAPAPAAIASTARPSRLIQSVVATHLDRTQMLLVQLAHAHAVPAHAHLVDLAPEQAWARELLASNRLYQQGAHAAGQTALAHLLAELEPVLLQVAHSPAQVTPAQWNALQVRIAASGVLFKIRVTDQNLQAALRDFTPAQEQNGAL